MIRYCAVLALPLTLLPLPWPAQTPAPAGDAAKGAEKTRMCEGCHGIDGWRTAFPEVYHVPKLGGQHAAYIVQALQEYKSGDRSHPSMRAIAAVALRRGHGQSRRVLRAGRPEDADGGQMMMTCVRAIPADRCDVRIAAGACERRRRRRRPGEGQGSLPGVPRPRRQQPDARLPEARRPVSRLPREGAARLQVRRAQEPDHGGHAPAR